MPLPVASLTPEILQQLLAERAAQAGMAGTAGAAGAGVGGMLMPSSIGQEDYSPQAQEGNIDLTHLPLKGNPQMQGYQGPSPQMTPPQIQQALQNRLQIQSDGPLSAQELEALKTYSALKDSGKL